MFPLKEPEKLEEVSVTDCAYLAGILDGEGTFSIASAKDNRDNVKRQYISFQIGLTDLPLLIWIQSKFGGTIYLHAQKQNDKHKQAFVLQWSPKYVPRIAELVIPYLKVKKQQMEILLTWVEKTWSGAHGAQSHMLLTDEKKQLREELRGRLTTLNMKGKRPETN